MLRTIKFRLVLNATQSKLLERILEFFGVVLKGEASNMTQSEIEAKGFTGVQMIDPPAGALDRLTKALAKASKEGRGNKTLADVTITFFSAMSGSPIGDQTPRIYAAIEGSAGEPLMSDYAAWRPQGPEGEPGVELYDCYAVANEINALK